MIAVAAVLVSMSRCQTGVRGHLGDVGVVLLLLAAIAIGGAVLRGGGKISLGRALLALAAILIAVIFLWFFGFVLGACWN